MGEQGLDFPGGGVVQQLVVSVSGGRTSGYMAARLKAEYSDRYDMRFVFANTGQEHENTLKFVDRLDKHFRLNLVWVEADVHHGERVGTRFKIVDFESASRRGEPYEQVIKKYGIPNKAYPHCNRELKLAPINKWVESAGLEDRLMAVGIRADEIDRMSVQAEQNRIVYPLVSWFPTMKYEVMAWWSKQPFDLELPERLGNCTWCWKKSWKKHAQNVREDAGIYEFPHRMEKLYGLAGHNVDGTKRVFSRGNKSAKDILSGNFDGGNDESNGCSEQCDIFAEN